MKQVERLLRQGMTPEEIIKQLNEAQETLKKEKEAEEKAKIEEEKKKVKVNKARLTFINAYQDYIFAVTGQKVTKEEVEDFKNNLNFLEKTLSKKPEDKNKYKYSFHYDSSKDDISKLDELEEIAKLWKHYFG